MIVTSKQIVNALTASLCQRIIPTRISKALRLSVKRILPQELVYELRVLKSLERQERRLYLKTRIFDGIRTAVKRKSELPKPVASVLFVCFGNIMRSPMCEALMERALADTPNVIVVTSAGLNATPGRPAHPWAVDAARELGISLEHHRARLLTADMLERTDVVFVMDCQNKVQLLTRNPTMSEKVIMLGSYAGRSYGSMEIVDPYYEGEEGTRRCYGILQTCIRNLVIELLANAEATNK